MTEQVTRSATGASANKRRQEDDSIVPDCTVVPSQPVRFTQLPDDV